MNVRRLFPLVTLLIFWAAVSSAQVNICLDSTNAPEEVSVILCRSSLNKMVAASNIINPMVGVGYYYSNDTGRTWKESFLKSSFGVYGDPILLNDVVGNFYLIHLSNPKGGTWLDRMVCQKSTDGGATWSDGSYAGFDPQRNEDKPGAAIDFTHSPYRNHIYLSWTEFDKYKSHKVGDSSRILFSQSNDEGVTWTKAMRLDNHAGDCMDGDNTNEGAVPCVGPEGEVYDAWAGPEGLMFKRSVDGGKTWQKEETKVADIIGGWDYDITGIDRCNGLPMTSCDCSNGPNRGTIYIGWSDQRNGSDNTDIWYSKSRDKGNTWSKPMRINNDNTCTRQFMTWLSIDQVTGYLYCLFYDRREHTGDTTDVYLAISKDGGNNFSQFRINKESFVPTSADFFGDYVSVAAYNNVVCPVWMQMNKHKLKLYTAKINPGELDWLSYVPPGPMCASSCEEGTNNTSTWFKFELSDAENVDLSVIDMQGKEVFSIYKNKYLEEGYQDYVLDPKTAGLQSGVYAYKLRSKEGTIYKPVLVY